MTGSPPPLLEIEGLCVDFGPPSHPVRAVDDVSLTVERGSVAAVIGESGSGKSTLGRAVIGTLDLVGGRMGRGVIRFDGTDISSLGAREHRALRGRRIALVPQDPLNALNPVQRVDRQVAEPLRIHGRASRRGARDDALELLRRVGIPDPQRVAKEYPHRLSGGMRQRVAIAIAIALTPDLIVADEPTTALDTTVQAEVLDVLVGLRRELGTTLLFISHDLGLVETIADSVVVMYAGRIVESQPASALYSRALHPYTRALLRAVPDLAADDELVEPIGGRPPVLSRLPTGCAFHPRCADVVPECREERPLRRDLGCGSVACHLAEAE